jgi:hypothetical protein
MHTIRLFIILNCICNILFKALNDGEEDNSVDFDYKIETASIFCNILRI